jgi:hypothetical protein
MPTRRVRSRFDELAPRILALVGAGEPLASACERAGVPYSTVRTWKRHRPAFRGCAARG